MQFITLDTVDDPRVEAYVSLTEMQLRNRLEPAKGVFIAESPRLSTARWPLTANRCHCWSRNLGWRA